MRRALSLCLLSAICLVAAPSANATLKVGVSDQLAKSFISQFYAPLHLKIARYIAPYDVMSDPSQLGAMDTWIKGARAQHQEILVSFEHSRMAGKQQKAPSAAVYTSALKAFKATYSGAVKDISPWNEVNRCQAGGRTEGQPTALCRQGKGPKLAATYYKAAKKVFAGKKIVALDVLDQNNVRPTVAYIKQFKKAAGSAKKIWGFHNYSDTNRFSNSRTKQMLAATGSGEVWLTETGGIVAFGGGFPYNEKRAAKALGCMFTIAKQKRITRLYIYQFNGSPKGSAFDAGLISADGKATRAGYAVVAKRKAAKCKK